MSQSQAVIVLAAGGHAKVLLDALGLCGVTVAGLTDADPVLAGKLIGAAMVLGQDVVLERYPPERTLLVNGLGSTDSMEARQALYKRMRERGYRFISVVHPSAMVARDAVLGEGVQLLAGAIVQTGARIGANTILNTGAQVDHDCVIGNHVHIAPGATLSGEVRVGDATHIGTNATVIQGVRIGSQCLVAAGAVLTSDVADGERVAGVPARRIRD